MKKIIAATLLSALVAAPVFAVDTAPQTSARKSAAANKPVHKTMPSEDKCEARHDMSASHGDGMMGGHASGMMGGYSDGMMGGHGSGMMTEPEMHMLGMLSLSKEQQTKINQISDELKHNNWITQGLMNDETAKLRDLYQADKRDPAAIGKEYQKVFDLKRQLIVTYLEAENKIEEVLTPEQRANLKDARSQMRRMYMRQDEQ